MYRDVFEKILEIENTEDILQFTEPAYGFFLWPVIRFQIIMMCFRQLAVLPPQSAMDELWSVSTAAKWRQLFHSLSSVAMLPLNKRDILFYSKRGEAWHKEYNGAMYNPYIEPLAGILPDRTLCLDTAPTSGFYPPNSPYALRRVLIAELLAGKLSRLQENKNACTRQAVGLIAFLQERIRTLLGIEFMPSFWEEVRDRLLYFQYTSRDKYRIFKLLLGRTRPKAVFVDTALYGGEPFFIRLAKEKGAVVAEIQHGNIYPQHPAYNWAPALRSSARMAEQTPDYFLTYGEYWHQSIRIPGAKLFAMGNPWFAMRQTQVSGKVGNAILVVLTAYYDVWLPYIEELVKNRPPEVPIILRPHPRAREIAARTALAALPGIRLDTCLDLYESMQHASVVVGEFSTSLFEAAALGKKVLIRQAPPRTEADTPFAAFTTPEDLRAKLDDPQCGYLSETVRNSIFREDWGERFTHFIGQHIME